MRTSLLALLVGVSFAIALPSPAAAQGRDPAGAEKLYDDGSKMLAAGDWAGACAKFEQSFALDPAPGTVLNLAACAEHDGRLALAWSRLKDARSLNADTASATRREEIAKFIDAAIQRLEPRIPTLALSVKGNPPGLVVKRDGQPTAIGTALPVDPGQHVIEASAPGFVTVRKEIVIAEAARDVIELELAPAPAGVVPPPPADTDPTPPTTPPTDEPSSGMSGTRIAGIALAGTGIAALGVSLVTGIIASGKESDMAELACEGQGTGTLRCSGSNLTTAEDLASSGAAMATVSTVTTFVGLGLVGAGVVLFAVGGDTGSGSGSASFETHVGPDGGRMLMRGRF